MKRGERFERGHTDALVGLVDRGLGEDREAREAIERLEKTCEFARAKMAG